MLLKQNITNQWILLIGLLFPNFLNNSLASWFLMNFDVLLRQIVQCDKGLNLFFVRPTLEFLFPVFSFTSDTIGFLCFYTK